MIAAHLSTTEVENLNKNEIVVLLPYGSSEQHGPYLPLNTDTIVAEEICKKIESQIPEKVLLYPALWLGDSQEHNGFAGTLSLDVYTSMKVLENIFVWLEKSGFTKCILYNAHGGNKNLAAAISEEYSRKSKLKIKSFFAFTNQLEEKTIELFGGSEPHAGAVETSLVYNLRPDLKKTEEKLIKYVDVYPGGLSMKESRELSKSGIMNFKDELEIDTDKAKILVDQMIAEGIKQVEKLLKV